MTCEWNPLKNKPSCHIWRANEQRFEIAEDGSCKNSATISVGKSKGNNFHLCETCAELPKFKRFKKTKIKTGVFGESK